MGLGLARWQRRLIDDHARLLLAWNAAVNLTAITDPRGIALSHVLDSLSATAPIRATGARSLLDLGSGGGYPGIPLAAILPLHRVVLVESVGKKARFLETVAAADGLTGRVTVAAERAESLARQDVHRERWDVVIARAVGALAELVELGFPLLVRGGLLVAWKRGELDWELAQARRALTGLGGGTIDVHPAGIDQLPGHRLLLLRRTGPVATRYPRDRRVRKREPW
jgi:16S rRNA (guanine527-N7)-methyltransferase